METIPWERDQQAAKNRWARARAPARRRCRSPRRRSAPSARCRVNFFEAEALLPAPGAKVE